MVAGDEVKEDERGVDSRTIPVLDPENIEESIQAFTVHLRGLKQAHKGLKPMPTETVTKTQLSTMSPGQLEKYIKDFNERKELYETRKNMAFAALYKATGVNVEIKAVRQLFMRQWSDKDEDEDPKQLIDMLVDRFSTQKKHKLRSVKHEFDNFQLEAKENLETGVTRLSNIILKLTELGEEPTEEAQKLALRNGFDNGSKDLEMLSAMMAMNATKNDVTFDSLKTMIKDYQAHLTQKKEKNSTATPASVNNIDGVAQCDYCGLKGHLLTACRKMLSDKKWRAKNFGGGKGKGKGGRGGRGQGKGHGGRGNSGDKGGKGGRGGGFRATTSDDKRSYYQRNEEDSSGEKSKWREKGSYTGCFNCGSLNHRQSDCTNQSASKRGKWNSEGSVDMIEFVPHTVELQECSLAEVNAIHHQPLMFLDSCCSNKMVVANESVIPLSTDIQTMKGLTGVQLSEAGKTMTISHTVTLGAFNGVLICPNSKRNLCGTGRLVEMGYEFIHNPDGAFVKDHDTGRMILECSIISDMPAITVREFMLLTNRSQGANEVHAIQTRPQLLDDTNDQEYQEKIDHQAQALFVGTGTDLSSDEEFTTCKKQEQAYQEQWRKQYPDRFLPTPGLYEKEDSDY